MRRAATAGRARSARTWTRCIEVLCGLKPGDSCLPCGSGLDALCARLTTALPAAGMSARPILYRCKMFRAALWSALPDHPQSGFLQRSTHASPVPTAGLLRGDPHRPAHKRRPRTSHPGASPVTCAAADRPRGSAALARCRGTAAPRHRPAQVGTSSTRLFTAWAACSRAGSDPPCCPRPCSW